MSYTPLSGFFSRRVSIWMDENFTNEDIAEVVEQDDIECIDYFNNTYNIAEFYEHFKDDIWALVATRADTGRRDVLGYIGFRNDGYITTAEEFEYLIVQSAVIEACEQICKEVFSTEENEV